MSKNFVHLSVRSDMSITGKPAIGDYPGADRVEDFVAAASRNNDPAIAFTELGSMRGAYAQTVACERAGINPIYGVEVYVCADHQKRAMPKDEQDAITGSLPVHEWRDAIDAAATERGYMQRERNLTTLTLWAIDDAGLKNLFALTSKAWLYGYYYKPRIDLELLREYSAGVACGSGSSNSWVMRPLIEGSRIEARERAEELSKIFGDRFYLEIRPHRIMNQATVNDFAVDLARAGVGTLLATQGAHYVNRDSHRHQKMLSAIVSGKGSEFDSSGLPVDTYWLRTRDEMIAAFGEPDWQGSIEAACDETLRLAERCTAKLKIDPFAMIIPVIDTGNFSHVHHLAKLCYDSPVWEILRDRFEFEFRQTEEYETQTSVMADEPLDIAYDRFVATKFEPYNVRLEHELEQLGRRVAETTEATFASYIVYVHEVVRMAKDLGLALGPGRGSAAGSLVNWMIGITDVDPIEHDLLFSRFIDPDRVGPPDIDIDCNYAKRPLLVAAMQERWGFECVAHIATFGKLKGRLIVGDVCRELDIDFAEMRKVQKRIDQRSDHDKNPFDSVRDAFLGFEDSPADPDCAAFHAKYPDVLGYCMALEGKYRSVGVHPGGLVVSPGPLWNYVPLEVRKPDDSDDRIVVAAFDMNGVDQVGLLKIDMLGVNTIDVLDMAMCQINERHGKGTIGWGGMIPLDDQPTLDAFTAGDFSGVFQFDSHSARSVARGVKFDRFGVVADITALNRPGPLDSGMAKTYVERMIDPDKMEVDYCDLVSKITQSTYGVMVYQEQVMRVCGEVGLHPNPDKMRKIIGKKLKDKIEAERPGFVAGAAKSVQMSEGEANRLYDDIAKFAAYSFNKSHSVAYGMIGYYCQYLKVHYPLEFYWALILAAADKDRRSYAKDAVTRGIKMLPPSVSLSGDKLGIDYAGHAIIGALSDVKGVGQKAAQAIFKAQPFGSFADFVDRTDRRAVTSGTVKALARAGAFNELLPNVCWFVEHADHLFSEAKLKRFPGWSAALAQAAGDDWSASERLYQAAAVNPMALASPYTELVSGLAVDLADFGAPEFKSEHDGGAVWISGTLTELREFTETPYGRAATPIEEEHESFNAPLALGTIESEDGKQSKIQIPWYVYRDYKGMIVDDSPVIVLAEVDAKHDTLRARVLVSLESMRVTTHQNIWTQILRGESVLDRIDSLPSYERSMASKDYSQFKAKLHQGSWEQLPIVGFVTDIRTKIAGKREQEMAWVGVLTLDGEYTSITVFASDWLGGRDYRTKRNKPKMKDSITPGALVSITVESNQFNGRFKEQYNGAGFQVFAQGKIS